MGQVAPAAPVAGRRDPGHPGSVCAGVRAPDRAPLRRLARRETRRMTRFAVLVEVALRPGIADPEGATIERALPALGFGGISGVRAGKAFRFTVDAADED